MKIIPFILVVVSIGYGCNSRTESPSSIEEIPAVKKRVVPHRHSNKDRIISGAH